MGPHALMCNQDKQDYREMSENEMDLEEKAETMCCACGKKKRENGESGCLDFC